MPRFVDWESKKKRIEIANRFLEIIAMNGRRFFHYKGQISRFELDPSNGKLYFIDKSGARIFACKAGWWGRRFTEGGTMQVLALALRDYVKGSADLPLNHLGPWPDHRGGPDLWGYGPEMSKVRRLCKALAEEASQ